MKITRVSQAGFTAGMAMEKKVRYSLAPSMRAASSTASGMADSMNCIIRKTPKVLASGGSSSAQ